MPPALLIARGLRVTVDGATAYGGLELETHGDRVLVGGQAAPLLGVLLGGTRAGGGLAAGSAGPAPRITAGSLTLCGADVAKGEHLQVAGLAPLDPPLPGAWTTTELLTWGARLVGRRRRVARAAAVEVLARLDLVALGSRRLQTLRLPERRAVVLALATLGEPAALVCEQPLAGLDGAAAAWVGERLRRATVDREALVSVGRLLPPSPESQLCAGATDLCWLSDGRLALHAEPTVVLGERRPVELTVTRRARELRDELARLGIELSGGPLHFVALLPAAAAATEGPTSVATILGAASRAEAALLRCVPLMG